MVEALQWRGGERVREIGTGSGYAAAVLARLAAQVDTARYLLQHRQRFANPVQVGGAVVGEREVGTREQRQPELRFELIGWLTALGVTLSSSPASFTLPSRTSASGR